MIESKLALYKARPVFEIFFFQDVVWLPMVLFFFPTAAKLIGPNLDLEFFKKNHFLDEVIVFDHLPCKGLKGFWWGFTWERGDEVK